MRRKGAPQTSGNERTIAEEMAGNRNKPEKRIVWHRSPYGMQKKSANRNKGNKEIYGMLFSEHKCRKEHRKETNDRACVNNVCPVDQEVAELHEEHCNHSRGCADESGCNRPKKIKKGELHL